MKQYTDPEMKVIRFDDREVVRTSDGENHGTSESGGFSTGSGVTNLPDPGPSNRGAKGNPGWSGWSGLD